MDLDWLTENLALQVFSLELLLSTEDGKIDSESYENPEKSEYKDMLEFWMNI